MIEYLDRHYPGEVRLLPQDPQERLEARLWDRLFDCYVMTPMQTVIAQQLRPEAERDARTIAAAVAGLTIAYDMIESRLEGRRWAAGDSFSMADCAAAPALFYASIVSPFPPAHGTLGSSFERLMDREPVRRVIAEARPYFEYFPLMNSIPSRFLADRADAG